MQAHGKTAIRRATGGVAAAGQDDAALRNLQAVLDRVEYLGEIGGWERDIVRDALVWSRGVYRIFGRDPKNWVPNHANFLACVHPDDRRRVEEASDAALAGGEQYDIEFRIVRPDGAVRAVHSRAERTQDAAGTVLRLTGTCQDITRRKQAEETLLASEERFRLLVETAPDAIMLYDADQHRLVDANPQAERLFGYAREEIVKHAPEFFYAPEQPDPRPFAQMFADNVKRVMAGEHLAVHRRIRTSSGEERLCHMTVVRLPGARGNLQRASFVDITEREATERRLERVKRALLTLSRGNEVVVRATSEAELFEGMCRAVTEVGGYRMAWVGTVEHDAAKTVQLVASAGDGADRLATRLELTWAEVPFGQGTTGRAIRSGQPATTRNIWDHPNMVGLAEFAQEYGVVSAATFPLKDASGVFAVLLLYAADANAFDAEELELLQKLADDLSYGFVALRHRRTSAELEQRWRVGLESMVGAIANMVELRDLYTAGHQQRVAKLAVSMARRLGLSEHDVEGIRLASIIHDLGKVSVPAEILSKPAKLSRTEMSLIREHAAAGYDNVRGIDFPWPIAQMVYQHHERLDGSGYPLGLKGDAILLGARIIAVADVIDAMTSHRPYRPALPIAAALAEIESHKGRLFDPAVVDACIALFETPDFSLDAADEAKGMQLDLLTPR